MFLLNLFIASRVAINAISLFHHSGSMDDSHLIHTTILDLMAVDVTVVSQTGRRQGLMQMPWRNVS